MQGLIVDWEIWSRDESILSDESLNKGSEMGACDFVVVVLVGIVLCGQLPWPCLGLLDMSVKVADSLNRSQGLRIESHYGSALVLPLSGLKGNVPVEQRRNRRGRELVADARMTLHDDLLTKGY